MCTMQSAGCGASPHEYRSAICKRTGCNVSCCRVSAEYAAATDTFQRYLCPSLCWKTIAVQVSVSVYRHFPSLTISTPLSHELIKQATSLNISTCSDPTLVPLMQLFLPCESVAGATFTTSPSTDIDVSVDSAQDENVRIDSSDTSSPAVMQDAAAAFIGATDIRAEVRPGMAALAASQRSCQLTDVFALSSSTVDVYITAQDTSATFRNYADHCSEQDSPRVSSGITWGSCRYSTSCIPSRSLSRDNPVVAGIRPTIATTPKGAREG